MTAQTVNEVNVSNQSAPQLAAGSDTSILDNLAVWLFNGDNILSLSGSAISTLIGALLAFWVGMGLYKRQQRVESLGYLQYAISCLMAVVNDVYLFKKQIVVERHNEAIAVEKQIKYPQPDAQGVVFLNMNEIWLSIQTAEFQWPVSMEKLSFLTNRDPNVILLLGHMRSSVEALNGVIRTLNNHTEECRKTVPMGMRENMSAAERTAIEYQISMTKALMEQVDSALYLTEKCEDLLIKYGWLEFCGGMKIKSAIFTDNSLELLRPEPIESWENMKWFPQKSKIHKRIFIQFMRKWNCLLGREVQ